MDEFQDYEEISNESLEVTENSLQKIDEESQELIEFKKDVKEDFRYARANIKKLIDTGMEAVETITTLVNETHSARFAECLANFLSINSVNNTLLLDLDNRYKNLINGGKESDDLEGTNITQNNTIFFGTTSQIQKMIEDKLKGRE